MENRFSHEIKITKYFIKELEEYLEKDHVKSREEAESDLLDAKWNFEKEMSEKDKEIEEIEKKLHAANLRIAQMGIEKGNLLKEIDRLVEKYVPKEEKSVAEADATGRP